MIKNLTPKTEIAESALRKSTIHDEWKEKYLCSENNEFFELAFAYIAQTLEAEKGATILDVGCGSCVHAIRLANHHFHVNGVDISENAIGEATRNIKAFDLEDQIILNRASLLSLPFEDATFEYILCWGVLMHIPEIENALNEIARVQKPGGTAIIGENNVKSIDSKLRRFRGVFRNPVHVMKKILAIQLGRKSKEGTRTQTGIEMWYKKDSETIFYRELNIEWLVNKMKQNGYTLKHRIARQFTEAYVFANSPILKKFIHGFNIFWFKHIKSPHLAFGNLLFFQKM